MKASVEQKNGTYKMVEMGEPSCGEVFCDDCGDCISCYYHGEVDYCSNEESRWVIYKSTK